MKGIVLAVLLISMATTFVPCCEFDGCQDEFNNSSHQNKREQKGTCSPFFACSSCSGAVIISRAIQLEKPSIAANTFFEFNSSFVLPAYLSSFWQPPKLS